MNLIDWIGINDSYCVRLTWVLMHFLWQGCDSALAAPLVLDLVRLTEFAQRRGEVGTLPQLACFFKSPVDVEEQGFAAQMDVLYEYVRHVRAERAAPSPGLRTTARYSALNCSEASKRSSQNAARCTAKIRPRSSKRSGCQLRAGAKRQTQ